MSARDDAVLSVRRYFAEALGEPWSIRPERREIPDEARPAGVVEAGQASNPQARSAVPQGDTERSLPFTVTLYPVLDGDERDCSRRASNLASLVEAALLYGLDLGDLPSGRPRSGPLSIPLYDYSDTPRLEPDPNDPNADPVLVRAGPEDPYSWMAVAGSFFTRTIQDPLDARRWTVPVELTVTWWAAGRVRVDDGPLVTQMPGTFRVPPSGA